MHGCSAQLDSLPPHLTSRFPAELFDTIIDHLHMSKITLSACSLVCKTWLPGSRYHLFYSVFLGPSFVQLLRTSEHAAATITPYIQHVSLGGNWMNPREHDEVVSFLMTLATVKTLHLDTWNWQFLGTDTRCNIQKAEDAIFGSLTWLQLSYTHFPSFTTMMSFVMSFPGLTSLTFDNITWDSGECSHPSCSALSCTRIPTSVPSKLRRLEIRSSYNMPILDYVLAAATIDSESDMILASLDTLIIPDISPLETITVARFLHALGPSLRHLELGFLAHTHQSPGHIYGMVCCLTQHSTNQPGIVADAIKSVDLSFNTELRALCIHHLALYQFPRLFGAVNSNTSHITSPYEWLVPFLSHLDKSVLSQLTFRIWLGSEAHLHLLDWPGLNRLFQQLNGLRKLIVHVTSSRDQSEVCAWLTSRLGLWLGDGQSDLFVTFADN